jgi:hypothetical protein
MYFRYANNIEIFILNFWNIYIYNLLLKIENEFEIKKKAHGNLRPGSPLEHFPIFVLVFFLPPTLI